jgi:hypothetical protein
MTKEVQITEENDQTDFEAADKLQQKYEQRERRKKAKSERLPPTPLTWQQKVLFALGVIFVLTMLIAYLLGSNQTTAVRRMLSSDSPQWIASSLAELYILLVLFVPLLCVYQLLIYFSNWSLSAYERWKKNVLFQLAKLFEWLSSGVFIAGRAAVYLAFMTYALNTSIYAMNFRLDGSQPTLVSTQLIERIPSRSLKTPATLVLKDWRDKNPSATVRTYASQDVFDIQDRTVTFYLRQGAFGWPYAVEKSFAQSYLNSQSVTKAVEKPN